MENAPAQQAALPIAPEDTVASEPTGEDSSANDTVLTTTETEPSGVEAANTDDAKVQKSPLQQRADTREQEDVKEEGPIPSRARRNPTSRDQARNRATADDRTERITRPRVVEERVFQQPPVSSIESIMTGIPAGRPRGQNNWDVLEEDEMRRLRRLRRIERRSRQRWPLF